MVVIGAGGDRDPGKRPLMGEIAARLADVLVVTDDNPRSEDPAAIRAAAARGRGDRAGRASAPRCTRSATGARRSGSPWGSPAPGDTVVVAGKGHETGQVVGDRTLPFDDRDVLREEMAAR